MNKPIMFVSIHASLFLNVQMSAYIIVIYYNLLIGSF